MTYMVQIYLKDGDSFIQSGCDNIWFTDIFMCVNKNGVETGIPIMQINRYKIETECDD